MEITGFLDSIKVFDLDFFTGVPDSQLKPLCNYLIDKYGISKNHIVAVNEGNAVALAAGYHLATGKIPVIYLQNSGIGNTINPVASLINDKVYGIPCIFIVGWRGEPGIKDEPQHHFQGQVTPALLEIMDIAHMVIDSKTTAEEVAVKMREFKTLLYTGKSVAFVVRKGGLTYDEKTVYKNNNKMLREEVIRQIALVAGEDIIVSTTGKTSRELFELREQMDQSHQYDFLTVGSMGHSSSIALGIALQKPRTRIWCLDGDGAALMHMGAMALIGAQAPANFIHVIINNAAHESVGGQPTVADKIDFGQIALGCGYQSTHHAANSSELGAILAQIKEKPGPLLLEAKTIIGSRDDLGRPTVTPLTNKQAFMAYLKERN